MLKPNAILLCCILLCCIQMVSKYMVSGKIYYNLLLPIQINNLEKIATIIVIAFMAFFNTGDKVVRAYVLVFATGFCTLMMYPFFIRYAEVMQMGLLVFFDLFYCVTFGMILYIFSPAFKLKT